MKSGLAAGFFCALAVAAGEPVRAGEIRVAGSDLLGPAFADALRVFTGRSEQSLALALEGSRSALAQLRENKADVALVMVPPGQRLPEDGFRSFALAYQVACVLVPANSPLTQITLTDLAGIYGASASPARVRWGELGLTGDWSMRAIEPQAMATGAGLSLEILHELVPASGRLRETVVQHPSTAALLRKLAAADAAIAIATAPPAAPQGLKVLPVARTSNEIAYAPTAGHVHAGDYPLRLPLWLVVRRATAGADLDFLQFLASDDVARALEQAAFITLPRQARDELRFEFERL